MSPDKRIFNFPLHQSDKGIPETERKYSHDDFWDALTRMLKMKEGEAAMHIVGVPPGPSPTPPQQIPKPWEGITEVATAFGINLGEMAQRRDEEIVALRQSATERDAELHALRLQQINDSISRLEHFRDEAAKPKGDNTLVGKLDAYLNNRLVELLASRVFPSDNERPHGIKALISDLADAWGLTEQEVRQRLHGQGQGQSPLDRAAALGNTKIDLIKIILESDLEQRKADQEDRRENRRLDIIQSTRDIFENVLPDAVAAAREAAQAYSASRPGPKEEIESRQQPGPEPLGVKCMACNEVFAVFEVRESYFCPACGEKVHLHEESEKKGDHHDSQ